MDQGDEVVPVFERIVVAEFLVTAVSLIQWIEQNGNGKRQIGMVDDGMTFFEGRIAGGIIDYQDVDFVGIQQCGGNSEDDFANGFFSIVGDNKNQNF